MSNTENAGPSSAPGNQSNGSEAVLNEVLVNQSALRHVASTGQPVEVRLHRFRWFMFSSTTAFSSAILTRNYTCIQDEDLALAKILQEQERAFLALSALHGYVVATFVFPSLLLIVHSSHRITTHRRPAENVPPPRDGRSPSPHPPHEDCNTDGPPLPPLTDEELAWKLMQEEEAEFERRMLALAGVPVPGYDRTTADNNGDIGDDEIEDDVDDDEEIDPDSLSYEQLTALGEVVGTVSTGLTKQQIESLPVLKYCDCAGAGTRKKENEEEEEQCAVCRIDFESEDEVTQLPCGHYYHPPCVAQWLERKKVCCVCTREVTVTGAVPRS